MEDKLVNSIEELESRITFQEDLLGKLDDALSSQQQQIMEMQRQIETILQQLKSMQHEMPDTPEPPPPHY
jgi:SlyX protein|tara:strand:+ start:308 stop:517 length:210 start_codon:yes stop_codon:yes gene_type:complete